MSALRRVVVVVALVAAGLGITAPPSQAATFANCYFLAEVTLNPGFSAVTPNVPTAGTWNLGNIQAACATIGGPLFEQGELHGSGTYNGSASTGSFSGNYTLTGLCSGSVRGDWAASQVHGAARCTGDSPLVGSDQCQLAATMMDDPRSTDTTGLVTHLLVEGTLFCLYN